MVIDWEATDSRTCGLSYKYMRGQPANEVLAYITYLVFLKLKYTFQSDCCSDKLTFLYSFIHSQKNTWLYYQCTTVRHSLNQSLMTSPCHTIYFETYSVSKMWQITVHESFMVNITIHRGFLPYTNKCKVYKMNVYEGNAMDDEAIIETVCGALQKESIYTRYHSALLFVAIRSKSQLFLVHILATYQVHIQGKATKIQIPTCFPKTWTLKVAPNNILPDANPRVLLYTQHFLYYFWYISNTRPVNGMMSYHQLNLARLNCWSQHVILSIYPGLLSSYWTAWVMQPEYAYTCNLTNVHILNITFHMYSTITLRMKPYNTVYLSIELTMRSYHIPMIKPDKKGIIADYILPTMHHHHQSGLRLGYYNFDSSSLSFASFEYKGGTSSLNSSLVIKNKYITGELCITKQLTLL